MDANISREELIEQARVFRQQGDLILAKNIYSELLESNPSDYQICYFLGMTYWLLDDLEQARQHIEDAIEKGSREDTVFFNYGLLLHELRLPEEAVTAYSKALSENPLLEDANNNLGIVLNELGEADKAAIAFENELKNYPDNVVAMNNLANLLKAKKDYEQAEKLLRKAVSLQPDFPDAHNNLGNLHWIQGASLEALQSYKTAMELSPQQLLYRQEFANAVSKTTALDEEFKTIIEKSFDVQGLDYQSLSLVASGYVLDDSRLNLLREAVENKDGDLLRKRLADKSIRELFLTPLCNGLLRKTVVINAVMERILTAIRGIYLQALVDGDEAFLATQQESLALFADQSFNNEYVFYISEEEHCLLDDVILNLENSKETAEFNLSNHAIDFLIIASYMPLYKLPMAEQIVALKDEFPEVLKNIINVQIFEVQEEARLKDNFKKITDIEESSLDVMAINEEAPYPRWLSLNKESVYSTYAMYFTKTFSDRDLPFKTDEKLKILVAGCGTGKHAIQVTQQFTGSDVYALDLSRSSLAYASRMSTKLDIKNIQYAQADILRLNEYDEKFHHIDCFGVLHHLQDPEEGLSNLVSNLLPNGTMRLGFYSHIARRFTKNLRRFLSQQGYPENDEGLRQARQDIFAKAADSDFAVVTQYRDFYTMSECRYLLYGAQDNNLTIAQIRKMLNRFNLAFLGFIFSDNQVPAHYSERFPEDPNMRNLENWEIFEEENPDTFIECYDFWCQKV